MSDVTRIFDAIEAGQPQAAEELLPLVHEVWLRLVGQGGQSWQNRRHFFSAAAEALRRILIERARRHGE